MAWAWTPASLTERDVTLREPTVCATEHAAAALRLSEQRLPADWEPLARLMLRTEGIASSSIEGISGPLEEIVVAELTQAQGDVGWVADNLSVVQAALVVEIVTEDVLLGWHRELMAHSRLPSHLVGAYRDSPGWIGGTSPINAAYVPPAGRVRARADGRPAGCDARRPVRPDHASRCGSRSVRDDSPVR